MKLFEPALTDLHPGLTIDSFLSDSAGDHYATYRMKDIYCYTAHFSQFVQAL